MQIVNLIKISTATLHSIEALNAKLTPNE